GPDETAGPALATALEPDIVLMMRDERGVFRMAGGAVVFPTGWAPEEKLNRTLAAIHGVVPGLNDAIGVAIDLFLDRLRPGAAATRVNWGLAATDELNLHPALERPRLGEHPDPTNVWLRVEHQILAALPRTG